VLAIAAAYINAGSYVYASRFFPLAQAKLTIRWVKNVPMCMVDLTSRISGASWLHDCHCEDVVIPSPSRYTDSI